MVSRSVARLASAVSTSVWAQRRPRENAHRWRRFSATSHGRYIRLSRLVLRSSLSFVFFVVLLLSFVSVLFFSHLLSCLRWCVGLPFVVLSRLWLACCSHLGRMLFSSLFSLDLLVSPLCRPSFVWCCRLGVLALSFRVSVLFSSCRLSLLWLSYKLNNTAAEQRGQQSRFVLFSAF